jgi:3-deoxy-alpha-D-manno-octulosonate 8-oxidase
MQVLEEFYPDGVRDFRKMVEKAGVEIPRGLVADLPPQKLDKMIEVSLGMAPLWQNVLGDDWKRQMPPERLRALYQRM